MRNQPSTNEGFFARHPRVTVNLVALTILFLTGCWLVTALQSGKGAYGHTIRSSPMLYWFDISLVGLAAAFSMIFVVRTAMQSVRWNDKTRRR